MIFVTAIAMIVNVCASKPDQLRRNEALEEMVHPMGCGDDQEKQQCDGGLQGQAALDGRYVSSAGHRGLVGMLVVRTHQRKLYGQHGTWVHLTMNSTLSLASSSVVWSLATTRNSKTCLPDLRPLSVPLSLSNMPMSSPST